MTISFFNFSWFHLLIVAQLDGSSAPGHCHQVPVESVFCTGLKCSRHLTYVAPVNAVSWLGASSWILERMTKILLLWSLHVALTSNNKVTVSFWGVGAVLGLHCSAQTFSSYGERGLLSNCSSWTSHCGGFSCCKAQTLGTWASIVGAQS